MKLIRGVMLCSMLLSAAWVQADPISSTDPTMFVDGEDAFSTVIEGLVFEFFANADGGGKLEFENQSGVDWFALLITTQLPQGTTFPDDYNFGGTAYTDVLATLNPVTNILSILFFDKPLNGTIPIDGTILNGDHFKITLDNVGTPDVGGWGANHAFLAQANALPVPGTLALFLAGLVLVIRGQSPKSPNSEN